jgi:hypothetical protein
MSERYTVKQVIEAITDNKGILSSAATALGCNRRTLQNYANRYPTVKEALDEAREAAIDHVESKLMGRIDSGDTTAMIFFLKTQGRNRGYIERQEVTGANGNALIVRIVYDDTTIDAPSTEAA